jgi:hypothetical protein
MPTLLRAQEDAKKAWTMLFDGKDFGGWQFYFGKAGAENDGTFTVQDGILICSGKPAGYMVAKKSYGNYTLQFEFAFKRPEGLLPDEVRRPVRDLNHDVVGSALLKDGWVVVNLETEAILEWTN